MNEKNILIKTPLDWSSFCWGITIPVKNQKSFHDHDGKRIPRGSQEQIKLIHGKVRYSGIIRNVDRKVKSDTLQILYSSEEKLKQILRKTFRSTHEFIIEERAKAMKAGAIRPHVKIPKNRQEFILLYGTGTPFEYEIEFQPLKTTRPKKIEEEVELKPEIKILKKD